MSTNPVECKDTDGESNSFAASEAFEDETIGEFTSGREFSLQKTLI